MRCDAVVLRLPNDLPSAARAIAPVVAGEIGAEALARKATEKRSGLATDLAAPRADADALRRRANAELTPKPADVIGVDSEELLAGEAMADTSVIGIEFGTTTAAARRTPIGRDFDPRGRTRHRVPSTVAAGHSVTCARASGT